MIVYLKVWLLHPTIIHYNQMVRTLPLQVKDILKGREDQVTNLKSACFYFFFLLHYSKISFWGCEHSLQTFLLNWKVEFLMTSKFLVILLFLTTGSSIIRRVTSFFWNPSAKGLWCFPLNLTQTSLNSLFFSQLSKMR